MDDVLGVVLTGGKSSRMGQDKALLLTPNKITWLEKQYELLSPFFLSYGCFQTKRTKLFFRITFRSLRAGRRHSRWPA